MSAYETNRLLLDQHRQLPVILLKMTIVEFSVLLTDVHCCFTYKLKSVHKYFGHDKSHLSIRLVLIFLHN